jgi:hypothetical protein
MPMNAPLNLIILISNRPKMNGVAKLRASGYNQKGYDFLYDPQWKAYVYYPQSYEEVDNIFRGQEADSLYFFTVRPADHNKTARGANVFIPKSERVNREEFAKLNKARLLDHADELGLALEGGNPTKVELLNALDAYYLGYYKGVESERSK